MIQVATHNPKKNLMGSVQIVLTCPCLPYNKALKGKVFGVYFISIKIPPSKEKRYYAYSLRVKGLTPIRLS
jgi:hypothetical protein